MEIPVPVIQHRDLSSHCACWVMILNTNMERVDMGVLWHLWFMHWNKVPMSTWMNDMQLTH